MSALSIVTLVSTLCVAVIGAIYFIWVRKRTPAKEPAQTEQK